MSDYTPTTDEIRTGYAAIGDAIIPEHEEEFDRWLAAHDAEVLEAAVHRVEGLIEDAMRQPHFEYETVNPRLFISAIRGTVPHDSRT